MNVAVLCGPGVEVEFRLPSEYPSASPPQFTVFRNGHAVSIVVATRTCLQMLCALKYSVMCYMRRNQMIPSGGAATVCGSDN